MQKEQQQARRRQAAARGQGVGAEGAIAAQEEGGVRGGLGSVRTTPIRSLDAGAFVMEMWVEEGKAKLALQQKQDPSESTQPSFSDPPPSSTPPSPSSI